MYRVDLIGVPGVGKSLLCRALLGDRWRHRLAHPLVADWEMRSAAAAAEAATRGRAHRLAYTVARRFTPLHRQAVHHYCRKSIRESILEVQPSWKQFIAFSIRTIQETCTDPIRTAHTIRDFIEVLEWTAYYHLHPSSHTVLFDESLTHRAHAVCRHADGWRDLAERYLSLMPKPAGVVHLTNDETVVLQRLTDRTKIVSFHLRVPAAEIRRTTQLLTKIADFSLRTLRARGTPAITIDGRAPLDQQVDRTRQFLASLPKETDRRPASMEAG